MVWNLVVTLCSAGVAVVGEEGVFHAPLSFLWVILVYLGKRQVVSVSYVGGWRAF